MCGRCFAAIAPGLATSVADSSHPSKEAAGRPRYARGSDAQPSNVLAEVSAGELGQPGPPGRSSSARGSEAQGRGAAGRSWAASPPRGWVDRPRLVRARSIPELVARSIEASSARGAEALGDARDPEVRAVQQPTGANGASVAHRGLHISAQPRYITTDCAGTVNNSAQNRYFGQDNAKFSPGSFFLPSLLFSFISFHLFAVFSFRLLLQAGARCSQPTEPCG